MEKTMNDKTEQNAGNIRPFGMRDKIGYMFGDFGNDFTFIFASSFLMVFYTKVLGISGLAVGTLFLVARCVDAVTDITMGRIVDMSRTGRDGKFKPWLRRMSAPVALASFLMYQSGLAGASMPVKMIYMYVTYLLWGSIFYTSINIPYGSMASAVTSDPDQRTSLSTFRGIDATLAGLVIGVGAPLLIYTTDAAGNQIVSGPRFTAVAGLFSLLAIVCYFICYRCTTERVRMDRMGNRENATLARTFRTVFSSRALLAIIGAAIGLLLSQLLIQSMNQYLYLDYFRNTKVLSAFSLVSTVVSLAIAGVTVPLSKRFGKKEVSAAATCFSGVAYLILYFMHITSAWLYMILSVIGFLGVNLFNMVIWANITDVIDDHEVRTGSRDDGTVYSVYSFARKIGQALAGGLGGAALQAIGYDELATVQNARVVEGIYATVNLIPAVCFLGVAAILAFAYPLSRKKVEENAAILKKKREMEQRS